MANKPGQMNLDADTALVASEARASSAGIEFEPTDEQRAKVKDLATAGIPHEHICLMVKHQATGLPISKPTLYKYFREELDTGIIEANAMVAGSLFKLALSGNVAAQCFWLKTRARWREAEQAKASTIAPEAAAELVRAAIAAANATVGGPEDPLAPPQAGYTAQDDIEPIDPTVQPKYEEP